MKAAATGEGAAVGSSWGNMFAYEHAFHPAEPTLDSLAALGRSGTILPYGRGHSVGDVCLNDGGTLLTTRERLSGIEAFDAGTGVMQCLGGTTFFDLLADGAKLGWFPPVVPSTKYLTVGGAVANDVHGRDHVARGTFGCAVDALELVRSDGAAWISRAASPELFYATVGGLGLTGLIRRVRFRMKRIASPLIRVRREGVSSLAAALASLQAPSPFEYRTVWLDGLARAPFQRGFLEEMAHAERPAPWPAALCKPRRQRVTVPFTAPGFAVNAKTVGLFNRLLTARRAQAATESARSFESALYQMDSVGHYYRLYGREGLLQWQGVFPTARTDAIATFLEWISRQSERPLLTIMKAFGPLASGGLLSFPMPGVTVVLDFKGSPASLELARAANARVVGLGGRVYPAKDACLTRELFARQYPRLEELERCVDPLISSSFWRRVHAR